MNAKYLEREKEKKKEEKKGNASKNFLVSHGPTTI